MSSEDQIRNLKQTGTPFDYGYAWDDKLPTELSDNPERDQIYTENDDRAPITLEKGHSILKDTTFEDE